MQPLAFGNFSPCAVHILTFVLVFLALTSALTLLSLDLSDSSLSSACYKKKKNIHEIYFAQNR